MTKEIGDYALLSDCRAYVLVSRGGSIEWLCVPEPDSPSLFGALLDEERGGRWSIEPAIPVRSVERRYLGESAVLETVFRCDGGGAIRVLDSMHVFERPSSAEETRPDHEIARRIECVAGRVPVRVTVAPAPNYAQRPARWKDRQPFGFLLDAGRQTSVVRSEIPLRIEREALIGETTLGRGDVRRVAFAHSAGAQTVAPMLGTAADRRTADTIRWWRGWARGRSLPSVAPAEALRSAVVLRSLVYAPTGAVLAAPTTSLPEEIGGERNWDYRYCWIRDASFAMRALLNIGVREDARAFFSWLIDATRLTRPRLRVMYDVHGRACPHERAIDTLRGFDGSRPVRRGNGARSQRQLDTYGALLDAAWQHVHAGGEVGSAVGRMLRDFVHTACDLWRQPDAGIWEKRSGPRHHTLSKAMCWVAMERGLRLADARVFAVDQGEVRRCMQAAKDAVEEHGFNHRLGSYVGTFDDDAVDASLLLLSVYGYCEPDSPRMLGTIDRIYERLGKNGALYRYRGVNDGLAGEEGSFGICGFWGVEALALAGRLDEAHENFRRLLRRSNDVGLYAEEMDVSESRALGNFPQALTHIGLINAACTLERARSGGRSAQRAGAATKG